jgi:hypothetical protein
MTIIHTPLGAGGGYFLMCADTRLINSFQPTYPFIIALVSVP